MIGWCGVLSSQRSAMSLPSFALQDKAVSRHFKSCVSAAEGAVAGKDGALNVSKRVAAFSTAWCRSLLDAVRFPSSRRRNSPTSSTACKHSLCARVP